MEQLRNHLLAYADMLYSWKLFIQRAQLLKIVHEELSQGSLYSKTAEENTMSQLSQA